MDQYERRKQERQLDEKYSQLLSAVEGNNIKALRKFFPTAKDLIDYNQQRRTREYHALEAMVQYSSPEFINEVFSTYFSSSDKETLELKDKFLQATSNTGEKLNYKYFSPYLPQELTDEVADCYGIQKSAKRQDEQSVRNATQEVKNAEKTEEPKSFAEKIGLFLNKLNEKISKNTSFRATQVPADTRPRMEQIYDIIKRENRSLSEYRNENIRRRHLSLRESDEKPVERLLTSNDMTKALVVEREAVPSIFVRKVDGIDDNDVRYKKDELVRIDLANNFDGTKNDLVKSLYQNADFPEDYMWAVSSLQQFEKEYVKIIESDAVNLAQIKEFAKDGGRFFIESEESTQCNCEGGHTIACAGKRDGFSFITFYANTYNETRDPHQNSLLHELIHRADHNSQEAFSNTEFFKQAAVLMVAENDEGMVAKKAEHIANNYKQGPFIQSC